MNYLIEVPGSFTSEIAFIDIETRKVPTGGFTMKNGEPLRNRWQAFLTGVARDGQIVLLSAEPEAELLRHTRSAIGDHDVVAYSATREFDEMVLRGRFTNARRAHEPVAFYPAMPGADDLLWMNCHPGRERHIERGDDIASHDVPKAWARGIRELILVHLLRDVAILVLLYGRPSERCMQWCRMVLTDYASCQVSLWDSGITG